MNNEIIKDNFSITHWASFLILVFFVKFLSFCIDPLPMFYLGDSHSYLTTAVTGWIPLDRSFVYGFVIRLTAVSSRSLTSLMVFQVFTSGLNAILIAYILQKFFSVRPRIAFCSGLLCALEPLQLMYERYVLTEAIALFSLVIYIILILHYLKRPRLSILAALQFVGTVLISFRLSFLSTVIVNAMLLPLLAIFVFVRSAHPLEKLSAAAAVKHMLSSRQLMRIVAIHLLLSLGLTYVFHLGYKYVNGKLSHKPPAYQYQSGIFLLSYLAPIVKPIDFPYTSLTENVFRNLKHDLRDRHKRAENHWQPGGLISNLNETIQNVLEADHAARATALNAVKRDPIGLVRLGVSGFLDYWNLDILKCNMLSDRGDRPLPPEMVEMLSSKFSLAAERLPFLQTFTNRYFLHAWPWYLFLICSPIYGIIALIWCVKENRRYFFVVLLISTIIACQASVLIEGPTVRYLHALGWLSFLLITPALEQLLIKRRSTASGNRNHV